MSVPGPQKHYLLLDDYLKSSSKKDRKSNQLPRERCFQKPVCNNNHEDSSLRTQPMFKNNPLKKTGTSKTPASPKVVTIKQGNIYHMSRRQASDFLLTHNMMQKQKVKLQAEAQLLNLKMQTEVQSLNSLSSLHKRYSSMNTQGMDAIQTLNTLTDGIRTEATNSPRHPFKLPRVKQPRIKSNSIALPRYTDSLEKSLCASTINSARELPLTSTSRNNISDLGNSILFSKETLESPKLTQRTHEFIAIQKAKLLGSDYSQQMKIQRIYERDRRELSSLKDLNFKIDSITIDLPTESSRPSSQEAPNEFETEKKIRIEHEVANINREIGVLNYHTLKDDHVASQTSRIDINSIDLSQITKNKHNGPITIYDSENAYGIEQLKKKSEFTNLINTLRNNSMKSTTNPLFRSNSVLTAELSPKTIISQRNKYLQQEEEEMNKARTKSMKNPFEEPRQQKLMEIIDSGMEELNRKMGVAEKSNRKLKNQFRAKKKDLNKDFRSLNKRVDKLNSVSNMPSNGFA